MNNKRILLALVVFCSLLAVGTTTNHTAASNPQQPPPGVTGPCEDGIDEIKDCPLAGCGENGDGRLNTAKNQVPNLTAGQPMTLAQIRALPQPKTWDTGRVRTIPVQVGEGQMKTVTGFLLRVKAEGGESCNCGLTRRVDTDIHFALTDSPDDPESNSVTAEVTPRVRRHGHPDWTFGKLNDREGEYVRIVGPLMLDTKHIPQLHFLPNEHKNKGLVRATNWEIHPILKLQVCTKTKKACDNGNGWEDVP